MKWNKHFYFILKKLKIKSFDKKLYFVTEVHVSIK